MITERTLKKWRREALRGIELTKGYDPAYRDFRMEIPEYLELKSRILRMTRELMDIYLLREKTKGK